MCLQPGSDSLPHVSVCCKSPASQVLLKESEEVEITGPHAASWTWKWSGTAAVRLWTTLPTVPNSRSMIFYSLDPQRSTWPARNLQHTHLLTASCHLLPTVTWYRLFYAGTQNLLPWRKKKCLNANGDYLEVWCVPSATHVSYICRSQNKDPDIRVLVSLFLNLSCN